MNKEPKFYNRNGSLTDYGLSCGYIEESTVSKMRNGDVLPCFLRVTMYKEHNSYHVRIFNVTQGHPEKWETFDLLSDARACYTGTGAIYSQVRTKGR